MFTFNLKGKSGILIFTLYNNRLGEGRTYTSYGSERKRLNSYAFFNTDTKELKIVINYLTERQLVLMPCLRTRWQIYTKNL